MIKQIDISAIPATSKRYKLCKIQAELDEFIRSGWPAAEITDTHGYKSASVAACSYRNSARNMHIGVSVILRDGRVFLVRGK